MSTALQSPMFLSGGAGFQSTNVIARSVSVGKNLNRQNIGCSRLRRTGDVEFISAPGAGHVVGIGDLLPVEPDIRFVVNSMKIQPDRFSLVARGNQELLPVPPRHDVGAVWLHREVGKVRADWISHSGRGAQIHAEIWV